MAMTRTSNIRIRTTIATLAALAALLAALAATAEAKPPRTFWGVSPQTPLGAEDFPQMGAGRVGTLRTPMVWAVMDPSAVPADYEWEAFDGLVLAAAENGIQVLPTVTSTPTWVSQVDGCEASCSTNPPRSDVALLAWRNFLRAAVSRYGPDGTFWSLHPEVAAKPIVVWQLWNEQNSPQYFTPRPDPSVYAKLVTEGSRAIKSVDPAARVILGGMFATPGGQLDPDTNSWNYLRSLYRQRGFEQRFDGVAIHPYAQGMRGVKLQVELLRKEMRRAGDGRTGLWVTEIGWASDGPKSSPQVVGKRGQAKKLRFAFRYFRNNRKKLHVRNIDWFSWRDAPKGFELCAWCPKSGLFSRDGFRPKPAWEAFKEFTGAP
jgi:hypothetical protein